MKVLVVGGVAGGATMVARLRRLDESAEIVLLEKGAYLSFANCGLPYHIGGAIVEESKLLLQTPKGFFRAVSRRRTRAQRSAGDRSGSAHGTRSIGGRLRLRRTIRQACPLTRRLSDRTRHGACKRSTRIYAAQHSRCKNASSRTSGSAIPSGQ